MFFVCLNLVSKDTADLWKSLDSMNQSILTGAVRGLSISKNPTKKRKRFIQAVTECIQAYTEDDHVDERTMNTQLDAIVDTTAMISFLRKVKEIEGLLKMTPDEELCNYYKRFNELCRPKVVLMDAAEGETSSMSSDSQSKIRVDVTNIQKGMSNLKFDDSGTA